MERRARDGPSADAAAARLTAPEGLGAGLAAAPGLAGIMLPLADGSNIEAFERDARTAGLALAAIPCKALPLLRRKDVPLLRMVAVDCAVLAGCRLAGSGLTAAAGAADSVTADGLGLMGYATFSNCRYLLGFWALADSSG